CSNRSQAYSIQSQIVLLLSCHRLRMPAFLRANPLTKFHRAIVRWSLVEFPTVKRAPTDPADYVSFLQANLVSTKPVYLFYERHAIRFELSHKKIVISNQAEFCQNSCSLPPARSDQL